MARNRYGWQKRSKELARKQKHDDKIKRRQGKTPGTETGELSETEAAGLDTQPETDAVGVDLLAGPSQPD